MAQNSTPHQILEDLLQGSAPARPLFAPLAFAIGARAENISLRAFLVNPTKIANSLRQVRTHLRSDAITCYFDSFLEAEALGGTLEWPSDHGPPVLHWPHASKQGQLPDGLRLSEEISRFGRVPTALEVVRRLKAVQREDFLLTACVSGPFTLAARLAGLHAQVRLASDNLPDSALEVATSVVTQVSRAFGEAGANLIFLREDSLPTVTGESHEVWASMLSPIFNIVRFYEGLPILQIADDRSFAENAGALLRLAGNWVICPTLEAVRHLPAERRSDMPPAELGVGLPAVAFQPNQPCDPDFGDSLSELTCDLHLALVTTTDDVSGQADIKRLASVGEAIRLIG